MATAAFCPQDGTPFGEIGQEGGLILSGRYEFISTIGVGGMSIIYKARQPLLNKIFAIKMLHTHLINEQTVQRFQQEARAITTLKHRNVISVYDFGISEHGQPYMVMDFIDGKTLADEIRKKGSLELPEAMDIFLQVCDALEQAHNNGILHRDLKPSNIMLIESDSGFDVRLVDFGIAKIVYNESSVARQLTQTGDLFGSPLYMSPEHCMGKAIDARSDIYSLGCILYESLIGRPPHVGETMIETIFKHLNEAPVDLDEAREDIVFPQAVNEFVMKLLATNPDERYQNVKEVKAKLLEIQAGALRGSAKKARGIVLPKVPRHVLIASVGALLAVAGVLALIYSLAKVNDSESSDRLSASDTANSLNERSSQLAVAARYALQYTPRERIKDQMLFAWLPHARELESLDLSGSKITGESLLLLRKMPRLKKLDLSKVALNDSDIAMLAKIKTLEDLRLNDCKMSAAGLSSLANISTLRSISLQHSQVDDEDIAVISRLPRLERLDLRDTAITDRSLESLGAVSTLRYLYLGGTKIGDPGLTSIKSLRLEALNISETMITGKGLQQIKDMDSLYSLMLARCAIGDADLVALSHLSQLNYLELSHDKISPTGLKSLLGLIHLSWLQLDDTGIGDSATPVLLRMRALRNLNLSQTNITDATLQAIAALPDLQSLTVLRTRITDAGVKSLSKTKQLSALRANGTAITDASLHALAAMPSLKTVELWDCQNISRAAVNWFSQKRPDCEVKIYIN